MEYRVLIKEGYHTMSFVYDDLEEATKFAESAKTHRVFSKDGDHDYEQRNEREPYRWQSVKLKDE